MILNSKISYKQNLLIINVLLLASVLPFTGARTGIVAFLVSLLSLGFFKLKSSKNRFKLLIAGLLLLPLVTFFIVKVPVIEQRISEIKHTPLEPPLGIHFNSINLRVAQLTCSKEILEKNWFLGVGTGDVQDELNSCYKSHGWSPALYERNYNTHNQYLQTWIASGLPGVLLFLTALVICITIAIRNNNPLFISFIVLFAIACLTESMLEKNKGIVFFMTFSVLQALPYLKYGKKINAANLKDEVYNV